LPTYQWRRNGANVGTGTNTYVLNGALNGDSVSVVMTSNATPCLVNVTSNSNSITLTSSTVTPTVVISANPGTTICNGTSVTFTANATNGGSSPSYQWIRNGVNVGTNLPTFISATLVTNDSISVVLTSNAACISTPTATSAASVMTVNAVPTITASTPASRCGSGTVVLGATASAGTINWYPTLTGGTSIATGVSYTTPTITATTTYFIDATANGCTTATRTSVAATVNVLPTVDFSSSLGSNGSVSFLNSTTNASTYSWSFGDGGTSTVANPTRQYTTNGTFQVKLVVTSANGCIAQAIKQIVVTGINSPVKALSGEITTNTTLFRDTIYTLNGYVFVKNNATLNIQSGTIIKGGADKASLIITRNGKIEANGTKNQPIIFTSAKAAGQRAKGDWGGLIILGKAKVNRPTDCSACPGSAVAANEPGIQNAIEGDIDNANGDGLYGGNDDTHNAGTLRYVRLEYGGTVITPGNEINGLTMGGLGSATVLENIQVSFADDDGFEWFGGTVNGRNLISFRNVDDDLDVDFGFSGKVQNAIVLRDSNLYDIGSGPTTNGFESDNDGTGTEAKPYTDPTFSNVTIVGPLAKGTALSTSNSFQNGARIRRNSSTSIFNSVIMGFPDGLFVDGTRTGQKFANDSMMFRNNVLAGNLRAINNSSANASSVRASIVANGCDTLTSANGVLGNPFNYTNPNFVPAPSSIALSGASFTANRLNDPFFKQTSYRGALGSNPDSNWTDCWSNYDPQSEGYTSAPYNKPGALAGFTATNGTGRTVNFTNTSSNAVAYLWNFGVTNSTTDTSVAANPSFVYPSNGTYNAILTAFSPCGKATFSVNVVVNDVSSNPVADFTYVQSATIGSREFTFNNTTDEKGFVTNYRWDFGVTSSSSDTSTVKNPVFNFPASGTYTVTLIATGTAGVDTISKVLNVIPVGIEENVSAIRNVTLYPNPTSNITNVSFDLTENTNVAIDLYDMSGRLVKAIPTQYLTSGNNSITIETSEVNAGIYFANITTDKFSKTYRLVIIK
jgi:PKD repeat protein